MPLWTPRRTDNLRATRRATTPVVPDKLIPSCAAKECTDDLAIAAAITIRQHAISPEFLVDVRLHQQRFDLVGVVHFAGSVHPSVFVARAIHQNTPPSRVAAAVYVLASARRFREAVQHRFRHVPTAALAHNRKVARVLDELPRRMVAETKDGLQVSDDLVSAPLEEARGHDVRDGLVEPQLAEAL